MAIEVSIDLLLVQRKMKSKDLADKIGINLANLSILKTGKAKAIRFSTLEALCKELNCQPGDILKYVPGDPTSNETDEVSEELEEP